MVPLARYRTPLGSITPTKYWYVLAPDSQAGDQVTLTRPVSASKTPLVAQGAVAKRLVLQ